MSTKFVHLHVHTDYSMLDGKGNVETYVAESARRGDLALSITDHGNMSGAYEFYMACMKAGLEPVIGEEFYFVPKADNVKEDKDAERFHVVILARNAKGFEALCDLSSESHRNFYYKPLIDRHMCEVIAKDAGKNLVVLSGCAASILSRKAVGAIPGSAAAELEWWRKTWPHFYIELQHHNTDFDRKLNSRLLTLARRFKLPWVITNDPHYVFEEECEAHDALLAIQTGAHVDDENRFAFDGEGYHLRTAQEMRQAFRSYGKSVYVPGMRESVAIAKACHIRIPEFDKTTWHIPKYRRLPEGVDSFTYLKKLTIKGLRERDLLDNPDYTDLAKHELRQIKKVGIADFLLITREINQWAAKKGIWVGPGRGSTAGSLVGYLVGIHKVDSVRYDLLFERFLNPERPKQPDVDTDYSQLRRGEVITHIYDEYGADNVLPVAAFQTMKVRGAFRKLATAMGMPFADLARFTKIMAEAWGKENDEEEEDEEQEDHIRIEHLPEALLDEYPELVDYIEKLIGTKSAISRHPAGVLIFDPDDPVRQLVPEMWHPRSKKFAAQYDLATVEKMGLMKDDILGLRNGDTIMETKALLSQMYEEDPYWQDPDSWIPDEEDGDEDIYQMLCDGHTVGVFQLEGGTMETAIVRVKPKRFEDIVTCTALYRKGPMLAGAPDRYLANKRARKVEVAHPSLKPILESSWGEMIYDEQAFQILHDLAGFSWARVDDFKTAMKKKDPKLMAAIRPDAINGFRKVSRMSRVQATEVWKMLSAQSSYLFNRSHAVAYSLITYQTARYKRYFPLEYLTACMRTVQPKSKPAKKKRQTFLAETADLGFKILPPDINLSDERMTCGGDGDWDLEDREEDGWMRFGFTDIRGIGDSAAAKIIHARIENHVPFRKVREVEAALPPGLFSILNDSGCLESIGGHKATPKQLEEFLEWQFEDVMAPLRQKYARKVKLPSGRDGRVLVVGELIERERKKARSGRQYMTWKLRWKPSESFSITLWEDAEEVWDTPTGSIVMLEGKFNTEYGNISVGNPDQVRVVRYAKKEEAA